MMGQGYGIGYGMMGGGSMMMILFFVLIGFLFYLVMNRHAPVQKDTSLGLQPAVHSEALKIAKSRLASGEITVEEFEQIKKNLL
ncbi:putative membrane protein [Bacillus sp. SLBN-46]|uniref:SHOCT domain-containing protein n=1 Tax=Bacillus sp. SLBN-46 TaxID=3042283 RepID=UPI00286107CC|nr:SHOCT domain-containing protein [Bacillus sp. SLBN-46]MDR6121653.1 putative membrane protein [Bacillus sp. SLBN-46]